MDFISYLPLDLKFEIVSRLDDDDKVYLSTVSQTWDSTSVLSNDRLMESAIKKGHRNRVTYLINNGVTLEPRYLNHSALYGRFDILKLLKKTLNIPWNSDVIVNATMHGHINIVIYLHTRNCPIDYRTPLSAARGGYVNILKYLERVDYPVSSLCVREACKYGQLECLKWLSKRTTASTEHLNIASRKGHLNCVRFLCDYLLEPTEETYMNAVYSGVLEIVVYLERVKCPYYKHSPKLAASLGFLDLLVYFKTFPKFHNGFCEGCVLETIHNDTWDCFIFLVENCRVALTPLMCTQASYSSNLKILKYLKAHNCSWDIDECMKRAIDVDFVQGVRYIHETYDYSITKYLVTYSINHHDSECFKYLITHKSN